MDAPILMFHISLRFLALWIPCIFVLVRLKSQKPTVAIIVCNVYFHPPLTVLKPT
jgi:hypothetical protein